jgi:HEAT repeat protein
MCLLVWSCLQLTGCGDSPGTFDPAQHDMEIIFSEADLETRRKASRNLTPHSLSDAQIEKLLAYAKDDKQDAVIRARIIYVLGGLGPERGNHLINDLLDIGERAPSGSGIKQAVTVAADKLSYKGN